MRHLITLNDLNPDEARALLDNAIAGKREHRAGTQHASLRGKTLAMIFEKASTRTRVSFEAGMAQLGGHALFLAPADTQLGRGETVPDTARAISRMVDAVMIRNHSQDILETFAAHSRVPVINALTDRFHPCQILADMQTWIEWRGDISGRTAAWIGDGNNVCHSYIHAARLFGFHLRVASPEGYGPDAAVLAAGGNAVTLFKDSRAAATGADLVITDTWASMGADDEREARVAAFTGYRVDAAMMAEAATDAVFLHCLPAHRGEEVTDEVLDGPQSAAWDAAENRLHAQKALLEYLLT